MADIFKKLFSKIDDAATALTRDEKVTRWLTELDDAGKREEKWRKEASRVVAIYEQEKAAAEDSSATSADFNILYANTETLAPAVYNNTPRPVVKRKIDKENPLAIAATQVIKNTLVALADTGDTRYTEFDELQKLAVQEALVPGRGLCRFSYDADFEKTLDQAGVEQKRVKYETVCGDPVPWDRVRFGYAKQWSHVPWMAYEHFMTREECVSTFGEEKGSKIKLTHSPSQDQDKENDNQGPADAQGAKFAHIWEVWDKRTKKQIYLSEGFPTFIQENDDPLGLEGFFNAPRPISFTPRIKSLVPNTLYLMYEAQAKELDDVTRRIGHLTRALKVRGMYDSTLEGLDQLLSKPENTLQPVQNVAAMQSMGGGALEKSIWMMPLDTLVTALQQLYLNRQQVIGTIQKICGVADIMLGASQASETLGAQEMKQAWGTMRIKRMQKEVQRFSRACFRMQAELAAKKFSVETFQQMTGLKFPRMAEKQQAQQALMAAQTMLPQLQMQAQQGLMAPEQAQAQTQQLQQRAAQAQQVLAQPAWEEIVNFLRNDTIRNFVIDIETNSTVDIEATEDKKELGELMNAMAQLLNGVFPMVKDGVLPFPAAKALMLNIIQKFRMGEDVEETFRAMQEPQAKEDPAAQKVKAEMERDAQKFKMEQQAAEQERANKQEELELAKMDNQIKREALEMQAEFNRAQHAQRMQQLQMQVVLKTTPQAPAPASPDGQQGASAQGTQNAAV
jgi:hypothetical protein